MYFVKICTRRWQVLDNELKRDDNATENIEFELPDVPFTADEAEASPANEDELSVASLFENHEEASEVEEGDMPLPESTENAVAESNDDVGSDTPDSLQSEDTDGVVKEHIETECTESETPETPPACAGKTDVSNDNSQNRETGTDNGDSQNGKADTGNDNPQSSEADRDNGNPQNDGNSAIPNAEASDSTDAVELNEESSDGTVPAGIEESVSAHRDDSPNAGEPVAPDFAPRFETIEIELAGDELEAIVGEVIQISTIETDADSADSEEADTVADGKRDDAVASSESNDDASPAEDNIDVINDNESNAPITEKVIPEDIFPDDAFAIPDTDSEGNPIITDLLGNIIEQEDFSPEEPEEDAVIEHIDSFEKESKAETIPSPEETYNPDKPRKIDAIFDFVELLIFTLVAVLCLTSFFVRHAVVEGGSMMNTLKDGDVLLISDVFYTPTPGDIVVVEDYTTMLKKPIVKRVIAVEGQIVRVTKDTIYINGKPITEDYVYTDDPDYEYPIVSNDELRQLPGFIITREYYEFMVPEGEIFVMGDHRDDSTDSRVIGTVKVEAVLGRALLRLLPFEKFGEVN